MNILTRFFDIFEDCSDLNQKSGTFKKPDLEINKIDKVNNKSGSSNSGLIKNIFSG